MVWTNKVKFDVGSLFVLLVLDLVYLDCPCLPVASFHDNHHNNYFAICGELNPETSHLHLTSRNGANLTG